VHERESLDAAAARGLGAQAQPASPRAAESLCPFSAGASVPLNVLGATHHTSEATAQLLTAIGGVDKLRQVTKGFYEKTFADAHLDQFVRE